VIGRSGAGFSGVSRGQRRHVHAGMAAFALPFAVGAVIDDGFAGGIVVMPRRGSMYAFGMFAGVAATAAAGMANEFHGGAGV